jgi:two-component sensor histidine kinase
MRTGNNNFGSDPTGEKIKKLRVELEAVRLRNDYLETLVKETYHRTKNHLSVLMSALSYRSRFCSSEASNALGEARTMVMSVVTLNDLLSKSGPSQRISTRLYLTELARKVFDVCCKANESISLELDMHDVELDPSDLLACGMIINELIINAFKHAFPDGEEGTITVFMQSQDGGPVRLGVHDDGMGVSTSSMESVGFELVRVLSTQLGGGFESTCENGTSFFVTFYA